MKKLYALRGATQCLNTELDICEQVVKMYDELLSSNNLSEIDIVSVMFSATQDLNAFNPCTALRKKNRAGELALFCAQEPVIQGSMERVIRVIIHCYLEENSKISNVYLNGTDVLRRPMSASNT